MSLKANILSLSCLYTTISLVVAPQFITFLTVFLYRIFHKTILEVLLAVTDILQPSLVSHTKDHDTLYSLPLFLIQRIMIHTGAFPCSLYKRSRQTLQVSHTKDHDTHCNVSLFLIQRIMTHSTALPCFPYKGS
jgi:hypothetical protein